MFCSNELICHLVMGARGEILYFCISLLLDNFSEFIGAEGWDHGVGHEAI